MGVDKRVRPVAFRQLRNRQGPLDGQRGICDIHGTFGPGMKRRGVQIKQFTVFGKRLEAVGKAFRDQQAALVVGGQHFTMPAQVGGRSSAQIHGDIEHCSRETTDELGFGMRRMLEMQATDGPLAARERVIDLRNGLVQAGRTKFFGAIKSGEEAARIRDRLALHELEPGKGMS